MTEPNSRTPSASAVSRRSMLKLAAAGTLANAMNIDSVFAQTKHEGVPKWEIFETTLRGPSEGNPFREVHLTAVFTLGNRAVSVEGFYDGGDSYKLRFMPDAEGEWSYRDDKQQRTTQCKARSFRCVSTPSGVHGPVSVRNTRHFAYADGTPFFPFGTTCYAWIHQSAALQQETLSSLKESPFNKLRMCIFPKSYEYNHNEPDLYPFVRDEAGKSDFDRPNPAFFHHLEERINNLKDLNIEADLILFHPYDRWGYATMSSDQDDRYLRYVLARLSAHRNVWWSMANEFDLMKQKTVQDFDRLFHIVEQYDPASHLRSVHYSHTMYDYSRPWVTHASLQTSQFEAGTEYLQAWKKTRGLRRGNVRRQSQSPMGKHLRRRDGASVLERRDGRWVCHSWRDATQSY